MNQQPDSDPQPEENQQEKPELFIYKDSGIQERHGHVPAWLWLVVVALIAWGIYYTVAYWTPPPAS